MNELSPEVDELFEQYRKEYDDCPVRRKDSCNVNYCLLSERNFAVRCKYLDLNYVRIDRGGVYFRCNW